MPKLGSSPHCFQPFPTELVSGLRSNMFPKAASFFSSFPLKTHGSYARRTVACTAVSLLCMHARLSTACDPSLRNTARSPGYGMGYFERSDLPVGKLTPLHLPSCAARCHVSFMVLATVLPPESPARKAGTHPSNASRPPSNADTARTRAGSLFGSTCTN